MKPTVKTAYIAALESGRFKQGVYLLKDGDTYSALGVLVALYIEAHPEERWATQTLGGDLMYTFDRQFAVVPRRVAEWAGVDSVITLYYDDELERGKVSVSILEDEKQPFFIIAAYVRKYL
jgi:hypothetical protein